MGIIENIHEDSSNYEISKKIEGLIDKLYLEEKLNSEEYLYILKNITQKEANYLYKKAREKTDIYYDDRIYMRGLIEFSNYCAKNCLYCGIRLDNHNVSRYRLSKEEILDCCIEGYELGYRTFVLQAGEDYTYKDDDICAIIKSIKGKYPECAVTLSIGQRSKESYEKYYDAGCDRYLLRHETASKRLYEYLHPNKMSFESRMQCLKDLKDIGYQVGAGFMVGSPSQTNEDLVCDIEFLQKFQPHMCGIGPYISHNETPLKGNKSGGVEETRVMLSLVRLVCPKVLLPSTTALGTIDKLGREKAMKSGANVVMPNLSPMAVREKYELYEDKICTGDEAAHCRNCIEGRINLAGYKVDMSRGDNIDFENKEDINNG